MTDTITHSGAQPELDLHLDLDSIAADRRLITATAICIRNIWNQVDIAKMYLAAGREFKNLHEHLSKNNRFDRKRIGWYRAFNEPEGKFGCDRRTAERCIGIFEAFSQVGDACPTWKLPQSFRALTALADLNLSTAQLARFVTEEKIVPNSTGKNVRELGVSLGLIKPKHAITENPITEKTLESQSRTAMDLSRKPLEWRRELLDCVGPDELRKMMSKELRQRLRDDFERQRQNPVTKNIASERAEMAAFDRVLAKRVAQQTH